MPFSFTPLESGRTANEKWRKAHAKEFSSYEPRVVDPANTVYMTRLQDRFGERERDYIPNRYKNAVSSAMARGKRLVNPFQIATKRVTQTTLPQMIPELTTEDPYDEQGRIKPGAIAPITAIKRIGRTALPNLRAYGIVPGVTDESMRWEDDAMMDYSMIATQGASFVAPVDNLNSSKYDGCNQHWKFPNVCWNKRIRTTRR